MAGQKIRKTVTVDTNDRLNPVLKLSVSGQVDRFMTISPASVRLTGTPESTIKTQISIIPEEKYFFKILDVEVKKGTYIQHDLEKTQNSQGKATYLLTVKNLKKEIGRYFDSIILKTDSRQRPEITISVYGHIFKNKT